MPHLLTLTALMRPVSFYESNQNNSAVMKTNEIMETTVLMKFGSKLTAVVGIALICSSCGDNRQTEERPSNPVKTAASKKIDKQSTGLRDVFLDKSLEETRNLAYKMSNDNVDDLVDAIKNHQFDSDPRKREVAFGVIRARAKQLPLKEGLKLLLSLKDHSMDLSRAVSVCLPSWVKDLPANEIKDALLQIKNADPACSNLNLPLFFVAGTIKAAPDTVLAVLPDLKKDFPEAMTEAYRTVSASASARDVKVVQESLIREAQNGSMEALAGLSTTAVRLSSMDPDAYAKTLESYKGSPQIYDALVTGYVQNVARIDMESAQAWVGTINDLELRRKMMEVISVLSSKGRSKR